MSDIFAAQPRKSNWPPRASASAALLAVAVVSLLGSGLGCDAKSAKEASRKESWERQIKALKAGEQDFLVSPDPELLAKLVKEQPEVAAKITNIDFAMDAVSDERLACLKQISNLKTD